MAKLYTANAGPRPARKAFRNVPQAPERILDAPDLVDDYYLNLLDWGSNNVVRCRAFPPALPRCAAAALACGTPRAPRQIAAFDASPLAQACGARAPVCAARSATRLLTAPPPPHAPTTTQLAIALASTVYLWNAGTGDIEQLMECKDEDDYVSSVSWAADGKHVAVGTSSSHVQIYDVARMKQIRNLSGHSARVGALSWNGHTLSSGGRDGNVLHHDVRCGRAPRCLAA